MLSSLDDKQKGQLLMWLKTPMPYAEIAKLLLRDWGIKTYPGNLARYYQRHMADQITEQRQKALDVADEINNDIKKKPGDFTKSIFDTVARQTLMVLNDPDTHPKIVKIYLDMFTRLLDQELRARMIALKERYLTFTEKQMEEATKKVTLDSELSEAEKAERLRNIFKLPFSTNEFAEERFQTNGQENNVAS